MNCSSYWGVVNFLKYFDTHIVTTATEFDAKVGFIWLGLPTKIGFWVGIAGIVLYIIVWVVILGGAIGAGVLSD